MVSAPFFAQAQYETPPYDIKIYPIDENFREAYYAIDQLRLTTSPLSYVSQTGTSRFCIDSPTFCVDALNNLIGIGTTSPGTKLDFYTASAENIRLRIRVDNATGDPYMTFDANGDVFSIGGDNSDSGNFVLSRSNSLGTNNVFSANSSNGNLTIPGLIGTLAANIAGAGFKGTGFSSATANGDLVNYEQWNAGRIRQMVVISTTGAGVQKTSTSGSYATTGLSGSVTISSNTSKVIVLVQQNFGASGTAGTVCTARIRRDSTDITDSQMSDYTVHINPATTESTSGVSMIGFDAPGAGTFTYSTRFSRFSGTGTCSANSTTGTNAGAGATMLVVEVGQ